MIPSIHRSTTLSILPFTQTPVSFCPFKYQITNHQPGTSPYHHHHHQKMTSVSYSVNSREFEELSIRSKSAKNSAYCPYSNFRVGCVILCSDGSWISGANVENASYPVGICAERTAIVKAVTEGKKNFRALAVATDISPPASPCGMCRQAIREFADLNMPIYMFDPEDRFEVRTLGELLPMSFGPDTLPPSDQMAKPLEKA